MVSVSLSSREYFFSGLFQTGPISHAYLQVSLDDISKKPTTINAPKSLFQYERLPFGISSYWNCSKIWYELIIKLSNPRKDLSSVTLVGCGASFIALTFESEGWRLASLHASHMLTLINRRKMMDCHNNS